MKEMTAIIEISGIWQNSFLSAKTTNLCQKPFIIALTFLSKSFTICCLTADISSVFLSVCSKIMKPYMRDYNEINPWSSNPKLIWGILLSTKRYPKSVFHGVFQVLLEITDGRNSKIKTEAVNKDKNSVQHSFSIFLFHF